MSGPRLLVLLMLGGFAPVVFAAGCGDVVDATVAEARAGSSAWSPADEQIVRSAAGAACIKTASQRYAVDTEQRPCGAIIDDTVAEMRAGAATDYGDQEIRLARSAAASACVKTGSGRYAAASPVQATEPESFGNNEPDGDEAADDSKKSGFSIGGLTIRPLTGPPSQKPYKRD